MLSFYLEDLRQDRQEISKKDQLLQDLQAVVTEDIAQIGALEQTLRNSLICIERLQQDIASKDASLLPQQVIDNILCIEVGHSFFPKDGVYAQLVSTGALELIEGAALKSLILEVYTHHKARNYATSNEIDMFNIEFRRAALANFRIRFAYDADDGVFYGSRKVVSSELNLDYYRSSEFFGLLGQASLYANMYLRQLSDIKATYIDITQQLEP